MITLILLLFSAIICQNLTQDGSEKILKLNVLENTKPKTITLTELGFIGIDYIPLETNQHCLIQRTIDLGSSRDRILFVNDSYIIKQFNTILKFDSKGSFVARIGTEGRGPNEFQACHDLEIDKSDQIYFIDGWKKKFFVYSGKGDFLKTINIPLYGICDFRLVNDGFLCYSENHLGNVKYSYTLLDKSGTTIMEFPNRYPFVKFPNDAYGFAHENLFYRYNNNLYKKEVYSDTIYLFDNMIFKPHMVLKVGDKLITPKARSEFSGMELARNYISPINLFEFGDYVLYAFTYKFDFSNTQVYCFIGSKKNDFQVLIDAGKGIINDLDGGPDILPLTVQNDNTVVACLDALQLKRHIASEEFRKSKPKFAEKKKELEKLASSLKETDNPVLVLVRLKK